MKWWQSATSEENDPHVRHCVYSLPPEGADPAWGGPAPDLDPQVRRFVSFFQEGDWSWGSPVPNLMSRLPVWVAALWWASLSTIGFLVVPLLFAHLPTPALAGGIAARLFSAQTWVSCSCGLFLLLRSNQSAKGVAVVQEALIFIVAGMLLALLSEFAVAPRIVARENLRLWHSVGSAMFVLQWLCAALVFWKLTATKPEN